MKQLLIVIILSCSTIFFTFSYGQTEAQKCKVQGEEYGSKHQVGFDELHNTCFNRAYNEAAINRKLLATSDDLSMRVIGLDNILYIERLIDATQDDGSIIKAKVLSVISGEMSGIQKISAVAISPDSSKIAVLNNLEEGESNLLIFNSNKNGNVSPLIANYDKDLVDVKALSFDPEGERVYILAEGTKILSYSLDKDSRSPLASKKPTSELFLSVKEGLEISSVVVTEEEVVVLFSNGELNGYSFLGKKTWSASSATEEASQKVHLHYNRQTQKLYIFDGLGKHNLLKK